MLPPERAMCRVHCNSRPFGRGPRKCARGPVFPGLEPQLHCVPGRGKGQDAAFPLLKNYQLVPRSPPGGPRKRLPRPEAFPFEGLPHPQAS